MINILVPPMFWIPSQREAVFVGQESVTVECHSEAFPKSINYWVNNKGAMLQSSEWMTHWVSHMGPLQSSIWVFLVNTETCGEWCHK